MALVTPETKLCDVIIDEPSVIPVINRFDIELGVGDKTIKTICCEKSIDLNFFLLILNAFISESFVPEIDLKSIKAKNVIEYLRKTNNFYLQCQLPNIERHFNALIKQKVSIVSPTPDIANARIEFENGAVANLTASRISLKNMRKHRVFQKDAYITIDFLDKKTDIVSIHDVQGEPSPLAMTLNLPDGSCKQITIEQQEVLQNNAIKTELERFHDAIVGNTEPPVTIEDGVEVLKVAYMILDEMKKHRELLENL